MSDEKKEGSLNLGSRKVTAAPKVAVRPAEAPKPHAEHPRQHVTAEKLATMSVPEIRAVATDRGYELGSVMGRAATALAFLKAQEKDETPLHKG